MEEQRIPLGKLLPSPISGLHSERMVRSVLRCQSNDLPRAVVRYKGLDFESEPPETLSDPFGAYGGFAFLCGGLGSALQCS